MTTHRWFSAIACVLFAGCNSGEVPVYEVKGTVSFNGKPMVGGGSIAFMPTTPEGLSAGGEIKADGTYELTTRTEGDGSAVGDYKVVITQVVFQEPKKVEDGAGANPPPVQAVQPADQIPAIYGDAASSPLTAKVEAKANQLDFPLQPQ